MLIAGTCFNPLAVQQSKEKSKTTVKSKYCSDTKGRLGVRSGFLCQKGAVRFTSAHRQVLRCFASSCSCWIITLRRNPPSRLYVFSVTEPWASGVVWAIIAPSQAKMVLGDCRSSREQQGRIHMNTEYGNFHNCHELLFSYPERSCFNQAFPLSLRYCVFLNEWCVYRCM